MIKRILSVALILNSIICASDNNNNHKVQYLLAANGVDGIRLDIAQQCGLVPQNAISSVFEGDKKVYHGQEGDIVQLCSAMNRIKEEIIGIGQCDGAATWINLASTLVNNNQLRALVLVSPYASAENLDERTYICKMIPLCQIFKKMSDCFVMATGVTDYNPSGTQPIKSIRNIQNKNLPILIIKHQSYTHFPFKDRDAYVLYKEFIDQGFENVFILVLNSKSLLEQKVHISRMINLFYKCFSLPYNPIFSEYSSAEFLDLKPSNTVIEEKSRPNKFELYWPRITKMMITLYLAYYLATMISDHLDYTNKMMRRHFIPGDNCG